MSNKSKIDYLVKSNHIKNVIIYIMIAVFALSMELVAIEFCNYKNDISRLENKVQTLEATDNDLQDQIYESDNDIGTIDGRTKNVNTDIRTLYNNQVKLQNQLNNKK